MSNNEQARICKETTPLPLSNTTKASEIAEASFWRKSCSQYLTKPQTELEKVKQELADVKARLAACEQKRHLAISIPQKNKGPSVGSPVSPGLQTKMNAYLAATQKTPRLQRRRSRRQRRLRDN
jgi:hypothetical protein